MFELQISSSNYQIDCLIQHKMFKKQQLSQGSKPQLFNLKYINSLKTYNLQSQQDDLNSKKPQPQSPMRQPPTQSFDMRRLKRAIYEFQGQIATANQDSQQEKQQVIQRRQAVKMNVFRQSAREQQRQFHQQNHEYLRMFSVIAQSAISSDKFKIKELRQGYNVGQNKGQNKISKSTQNYAIAHLQLQTEMTSSLINYKFPVRDIYNIVPFKRQSIELECRLFLDPKFEFFIFEKGSQRIEQVRNNLRNVLEEGLTSQFKGSVIRTLGNIEYFEYLDLINFRQYSSKSKGIEYPSEIVEIAEQNEIFEINSDQEQFYTKEEIKMNDAETNQRMVACQDFDLQQTAPSVYFELTQEYTLYKKYRQIQFKKLKIYDKDITLNTDIRNIISSQKIYLIQLVKEIDLYIELSTHPADIKIMNEVYKQLRRKSEEFLKVLCNYTESKILKHYNIDNYHEKIMMFIQKSIKYNKEIENLDHKILNQFPILKIWYEIPKILFGYSREKLHLKYYDLIRAMLLYEQKIKDYELQKQLSIKRPNVKYPE